MCLVCYKPNFISKITTYKIVNVSFNISSSIPPQSFYDDVIFNYYINNTHYNNSHKINITILPSYNFSLNYNINKTKQILNTGGSGILFNFTIKNEGNVDLFFDFKINGSIKDLNVKLPKNRLVYKGEEDVISVFYEIPPSIKLKTYNGSLIIFNKNSNQTKYINLSLEVVDKIPPTIQNINITNIQATKPYKIFVSCDDNDKVKNVTGEVFKNNTLFTKFVFKKIEGRKLYYYNFTNTSELGDYKLKVDVCDISNNCNKSSKSFKVVRLNVIEYKPLIRLPDRRYGSYSEVNLLNITFPTKLKIKLINLTYLENTTWKMVVVYPDGNEVVVTSVGGEVNVKKEGSYKLKFYGEKEGDYFGELKLIPIPQHVNLSTISFSGKFVSCYIPKNMVKQWYRGWLIRSVPNSSSGDICNQYYNLTVRYPISSYNPNIEEQVPISPNLIDQQKMKYENEISSLKKMLMWRGLILIISIVIIIIIVLVVVGIYYYTSTYHLI